MTTEQSTRQASLTATASASAPHHLCYLTGDEEPVKPLDMTLQCLIAKFTGGASPASVSLAWMDWLMHLSASPGKQIDLLELLKKQSAEWPKLLPAAWPAPDAPENPQALSKDRRFTHPGWNHWPFNALGTAYLQGQQFWQNATTGVRGVSAHHENMVSFMARQMLDMSSPSNYPWLNPEVLSATLASGGTNLYSGWSHWLEDHGLLLAKPAETAAPDHVSEQPIPSPGFQAGRDVAITPGKVVFRNHLFELLQYAPQTAQVYAEPVLIVPSWIMKYYILDLSPHNSVVGFLVKQGHTVFMISWKNPGKEHRDLGMHDYLCHGLLAALAEVARITHKKPLHAAGYCLGGTLLSIAMAALAKDSALGNQTELAPIKSMTLLAAQTDFEDPGELGLFVDESQLAMLDALMWEQGYLSGEQMAGSFQLLNSRDLIWSKNMREYQLGTRAAPNDLMAWNADRTRLPYRMHSEYMQHLYLHNDLANGRYTVNGHAIALNDIGAPMFVVATARDHISPWRSVYKIHLLCDASIDFILASGGHNGGIISEPGQAHHSYRHLLSERRTASYIDPTEWLQQASTEPGSWWPHWHAWLARHSSKKKIPARQPHSKPELGDAPGRYVLEK